MPEYITYQPQLPEPEYTWEPTASPCDCWSCRDFAEDELRELAAAIRTNETHEHFTPVYIPHHPTDDYINITPEKEPVIHNPLPEPAEIRIYSRHNPTQVVAVAVEVENLIGYNFSRASLDGANFAGMDLTNANFSRARLHNATFEGATVDGANFDGAYLNDSNFRSVSAEGTSFRGANADYLDCGYGTFTEADFYNASCYSMFGTTSADWEGANFQGAHGVQVCGECEEVFFRGGSVRYCEDIDGYRCYNCGYEECEYCGDVFNDLDYHQDNCGSRRHSALHEYDYTPYRFRPKGNYPAEPLMGVELEIGGDEYTLTSIVNDLDPGENHLYCKHDGSVDGIEVVTHPMTLNWAKQEFNFKGLLRDLSRVGHSHDGYGIHVHVSRNAFRGVNPDGTLTKRQQPAHQMTWLMFMYRNSDSISQIARRTSDNWASWRKPGKGELKRKATQPDHSTGRYVAINCENDKTYEVRVFRSTLNFTEFMAAIEMVDASVNYTRGITTNDVLHNRAMSWMEFHKWCKAQGQRYSNLLNQMVVQGTLDD